MESGSYKELQSKGSSARFMTVLLISSVTVILCLLIGVGTYILVAGSNEGPIPVTEAKKIVEEVVIVENLEPETRAKVVQHPAEIDFKQGMVEKPVNQAILGEVQEAIQQEELVESPRQPFRPEQNEFIRTLVRLSNDVASELFNKFAESGLFPQKTEDSEEEEHHGRSRRSIMTNMGLSALKYVNYLSFGRFMFNEVYSITEFAEEGRKLSGDAEAFFLDGGFWPAPSKKMSEKDRLEEKIDTEVAVSETTEKAKPVRPNRPPSAYDNGWTPMVNKVSLKFITNMLTTLLNLMREYLMKDHVMECLWFMFCKDMNHQAKYTDPMGYLARVNSVGLQVLIDKEGRQVDTISSVWRALTQWEPLHCESMFPQCDGSKALEIVNEVANASRR